MSIDSGDKLLDYVSKVSKEQVTLADGRYWMPPTSVRINESFFLKDDCVMCGKCCPCETNAWTQEGWNRMLAATPEDFTKWGLDYGVLTELGDVLQKRVLQINGKDVTLYWVPKPKMSEALHVEWPDRKEQPRCRWLFEKDGTYRCRIHPVRSVTCGMPHLRMVHNADTHSTTMGLMQFGRNWALRCPVEFGGPDEESVQVRILWLRRLLATAEDMGVNTWLPEILEYLEGGGRQPRVFNDHKRKLFEVRKV